ncbi:hypothetical protein ABMA28_016198 [Loxostege sticticalis]|uniref:Uncharacterized protein n=1 Tax=Loxostege sticticalis TaxID=481309 RepID=A0ABD0T9V7_LOXSC
MSSDDYQVQNIYRYSRKSYKKNHRETQDEINSPRNIDITELSPTNDERNEGHAIGSPGCSCDMDSEGEVASILHKKCPVITLAQQQLHRLLDETDKLLCDNTRCCRSVYDFLCICKDLFLKQDKCLCALIVLIAVAFFTGILIGAATCGSYLGRFNSPILSCIDNFFIPDSYTTIKETYLSIT